MAVWMVRAGKHGEDEEFALNHKIAVIGFRDLPDLKGVGDIRAKFREVYPEKSVNQISQLSGQLEIFKNRIQKGDIIALPSKERPIIAFGVVKGDYAFVDGRHTRPVDWDKEVPRKKIGQDLLYSLGAFLTICQIRRNDAENRIRAILAGNADPAMNGGKIQVKDSEEGVEDESPEETEPPVDLEEQIYYQIRTVIEAKFKGDKFASLIDGILKAQGYQTRISRKGADGGADIVAAMGTLGFEEPKICVQVKSGGEQNDQSIRELEGVMGRVGAKHGLFVSWDGFKGLSNEKSNELFFRVRLWNDLDVMKTLFENYEKLSDDIKAELPLKRIWMLVQE